MRAAASADAHGEAAARSGGPETMHLAGSPDIAVAPRAAPPVTHALASPARLAPLRPAPFLGRTLRHWPPVAWVLLDWSVVALATWVSYRVLVFGNPAFRWVVGPWLNAGAFCACLTVAGMIFGLYERQTLLARSRILVRSALTLSLGGALAFALILVLFYAEHSRWIGLSVGLAYLLIATPLRLTAHSIISTSRMNVLCVGTSASVRRVVSLLRNGHRGHYQVVGHLLAARVPDESRFVAADEDEQRAFEAACPCLGTLSQMRHVLRGRQIEQVIVDHELVNYPAVEEAVQACLESGCRVTDQPTFTERLLGEVPADAINTRWLLLADVDTGGTYDAVKRIADIAAALVGLVLTGPLWPLLALLIRLDSPGPVFFRQQRVGRHGRLFCIYKFRTMRLNAETHGAQWAVAGDPRVTRLGRLLRQSRLDELPQFWNILRGDMSLVGPRPERPEFVEQLARQIPHYRQRHLIKPGLTGWAQINYSYGASVEDAHRKLCYDLYYLKHRSIELDAAIIIRTVGTFVLGAH
jgi:exopolysaccharide biosynthesis polyprenyl glycosylphosphotransferase